MYALTIARAYKETEMNACNFMCEIFFDEVVQCKNWGIVIFWSSSSLISAHFESQHQQHQVLYLMEYAYKFHTLNLIGLFFMPPTKNISKLYNIGP